MTSSDTDREATDAVPDPFPAPPDSDDGPGVNLDDLEDWVIERAVLNDDQVGREIVARFVRMFGAFVTNDVRPMLREVASNGGEPQLLVNGLAALLRTTADSIEFPLDHPRSSSERAGEDEA